MLILFRTLVRYSESYLIRFHTLFYYSVFANYMSVFTLDCTCFSLEFSGCFSSSVRLTENVLEGFVSPVESIGKIVFDRTRCLALCVFL